MARSEKTDIIGVIAIMVGAMLIIGATMFLLVVLLNVSPGIILVPPLIQIALGILAAVAGFLLWRGHERALPVLVVLGVAVLANAVFLLIVMLTAMPPGHH